MAAGECNPKSVRDAKNLEPNEEGLGAELESKINEENLKPNIPHLSIPLVLPTPHRNPNVNRPHDIAAVYITELFPSFIKFITREDIRTRLGLERVFIPSEKMNKAQDVIKKKLEAILDHATNAVKISGDVDESST
jgi:hypothetical protein